MGEVGVKGRFVVDTKAFGGIKKGSATREGIVKDGRESLRKLGVEKVRSFEVRGGLCDMV